MKRSLLTIFFLAMGLSAVFAQTVTVRGTVTDVEDGQPLAGVAVIQEGTSNGTLTDNDGRWSLSVNNLGGQLFYSLV